MRGVGTLLFALGACYAPSVAPGAPCDPLFNNCPSGQDCLPDGSGHSCGGPGTVTDAAIDAGPDGPPSDPDGDGIPSTIDNCPELANLTQHDEDDDNVGDVCDPCPVSSNNADADGDRVGDACDPRPMMGGDTLVLFEPFAQGIPTGWTGTTSANGTVWTVANDELRIASDSGVVSAMRTTLPATPRMMAVISVVADQMFGPVTSVGVVNPYSANMGGGGLLCSLYQEAAGSRFLSMFDINPGIPDNHDLAWVDDTPYILVSVRVDSSFTCLTIPMLVASPQLTSTTAIGSPVIGLRSDGATARFQWLMVVQIP